MVSVVRVVVGIGWVVICSLVDRVCMNVGIGWVVVCVRRVVVTAVAVVIVVVIVIVVHLFS